MTPTQLRASLKEAQLSQAAFADIVGVTPKTVSTWMTGNQPVPDWVPLAIDGLKWRKLVEMVAK